MSADLRDIVDVIDASTEAVCDRLDKYLEEIVLQFLSIDSKLHRIACALELRNERDE